MRFQGAGAFFLGHGPLHFTGFCLFSTGDTCFAVLYDANSIKLNEPNKRKKSSMVERFIMAGDGKNENKL